MSVSIDQFNALQAQLAQMAQMMAKLSMVSAPTPASGKSGKAKKERKPKDPDAPKKAPTAWALLCKELNPRINALYKATFSEEKVPQGLPMRVCGLLKERSHTVDVSDDQISEAISFIKENPDHKSKTQATRSSKSSEAGSVSAGEGSADAKPAKKERKPMSDDAKAALVARLSAGKARKAAEKQNSDSGSSVIAPVAVTASVPAPTTASPPAPTPVAKTPVTTEAGQWKSVLLKGARYLYNTSTFHCYHREVDGTQGAWAGVLNLASKSIDDSVPEPGTEEEDVDLDA